MEMIIEPGSIHEFLAICPAVDSAAQAMEIAARLADVLDLKVSVGVAWTMDPIDADWLIAQADSAMYSSKRSGSCRATLFEGAHHFSP
jgi:PleD family two-component response regulator